MRQVRFRVSLQTPQSASSDPASLLAAARGFAARGDDEPAKRALLDILRIDPDCLEALMEIARLALRGGYRSAAMTAYQQAALRHPREPAARINLGNVLLEIGELEAAGRCFASAVDLAPGLASAHLGLARTLTALGHAAAAEPHWIKGFAGGPYASQPCRGQGRPIRVLLLVSTLGGNIPTRPLLDDTLFEVTAAFVEAWTPAQAAPPHDVIFNAIGDADLCGAALARARAIVSASAAPVVNAPDAVAMTGRAANAGRLSGLEGLVVPRIEEASRAALLADERRSFPLLVRSPGYNTGQHFVRVERRQGLSEAISALPGDRLLAIEPLDARGPDGLFRKYRVMLIGGRLYPLHLAVSADWKVHYFSADMAGSAVARAEEAAFLDHMPAAIGARATEALGRIGRALGLDYAGVDFAVAPDGRLQLFEANAGMVIHPPGPEAIWAYRRQAAERARAAFEALLVARARQAADSTAA